MVKEIKNKDIYLSKLNKSLVEKLKISKLIPLEANDILDVGCASGGITNVLAIMYQHKNFFGIDLDCEFIKKARIVATPNANFRCICLRDLLNEKKRFGAILFCSVMHEIFSYGQGVSSVIKALCNAYELLVPGGVIIIRDMILSELSKKLDNSENIKVLKRVVDEKQVQDFEKIFGPMKNVYDTNHFLLKYWYTENWDRECPEHYVPITFEQYENIFKLLNVDLLVQRSYTIDYLLNKWNYDFGFKQEDLEKYKSTGILMIKKIC